jgi:hypothetical protein
VLKGDPPSKCRNCRKNRRGRPVGKVRLSYDPRRTSRPRRAPNIPFTGSTHPLLFEAGCGVAIATAGRTSGQCYYRVPRFRGRAVVIREPRRPACGGCCWPRPPAGGRLGPAPNGHALLGPHAMRVQLLGDGCQRRFTNPLDLRKNCPRRGIGFGYLFRPGCPCARCRLDAAGCNWPISSRHRPSWRATYLARWQADNP